MTDIIRKRRFQGMMEIIRKRRKRKPGYDGYNYKKGGRESQGMMEIIRKGSHEGKARV